MRTAVRNTAAGLVVALFSFSAADPAAAQSWPAKPIMLLNPAPAGGLLDNFLRLTSQFVSQRLGQPIVVESRSGGGGVPLGIAVAQGPADGHMIGTAYASHVINPHTMKSLPYDAFRDFVPVTRLVDLTALMVAPADAPYSSVTEMIKYARENPGKINVGVPGLGGSIHFGLEALRLKADISVELIPYRGEAPAAVDLLGGRLQLTMLTVATGKPHVEAGKIKILAVMTEKRVESFPNIPAIMEEFPGYSLLPTWYGLFVRAGTPQAIVDRLAVEFRAAVQDPSIKAKLLDFGLQPVGSSPVEFAAQLKNEHEIYGELVRKTGFKLE